MPVRTTSRPVMRNSDAAAPTRSTPQQEPQALLKRFTDNIDLPLLLLCPVISVVGLVFAEPPALKTLLFYSGILGFAVALVMNHRKHRAKRQP